MAEDWASDVKKYAPDADDAAIAGIVRYCGIALRKRDSSLVSFADPAETARVRENYCRKKLGLTQPDAEIDAAIGRVGERMQGDATKNRVTVYYLLADAFGKLGLFGGAGSAAPTRVAPAAVAMGAIGTPLAAAAPVRPRTRDDDGRGGIGMTALGTLALLGAIIIGTATIGSQIGGHASSGPAAPPADIMPSMAMPVPATSPAAPAVPEGSGVVAQDVAGRPQLSVYFDTAKAEVSPDFASAAAPVKAWVDGHPGARLAVSGFNDPRGNAAMNAELSKNRAQNVAAALAALGVPADAIDLEKPPETTDTGTTQAQARRVDVMVRDPG